MHQSLLGHMRAMARNNAWSNARLHRACVQLTPEELAAERVGFFPSIQQTLSHILAVDRHYVADLAGVGRAAAETVPPGLEAAALADAQAEMDRRLIAFCEGLDVATLSRVVPIDRQDGVEYRETVYAILAHLFVHQIHHRGQVHAMLAGTRVPPPQLDEFFLASDAALRAAELRRLGLDVEVSWEQDISLETARRSYAQELRFVADVRSPAVVEAFATVPRERFVGDGPWRVRSPMSQGPYWTTEDADPRHVYHDVLIALDESRGINNGQPSLWASLLGELDICPGESVVHLGCGTGYYSAILAQLVGLDGSVTAVEIDSGLAELALAALAPWPQVRVVTADGSTYATGSADLIVASAGATHPPATWLDSLAPDGRLLFPLTADDRGGAMLLVTRRGATGCAARFVRPVGFIEFAGARDTRVSERLQQAFRRHDMHTVQSLRRDAHPEDESCWLHADDWCLSRLDLTGTQAAT